MSKGMGAEGGRVKMNNIQRRDRQKHSETHCRLGSEFEWDMKHLGARYVLMGSKSITHNFDSR
jgi:hypothetical protein